MIDHEVVAHAAEIVGCPLDVPITGPDGFGRTFREDFCEAVNMVSLAASVRRSPLPSAGQVRKWLKRLANPFADQRGLTARATEMWNYFSRPGAPPLGHLARLWRMPESDLLTGLADVFSEGSVYFEPPEGPQIDFTRPSGEWREIVLGLHRRTYGQGGAPVQGGNPKRWAAAFAVEIVRDHGTARRIVYNQEWLASFILQCATGEQDFDLRRFVRLERKELKRK